MFSNFQACFAKRLKISVDFAPLEVEGHSILVFTRAIRIPPGFLISKLNAQTSVTTRQIILNWLGECLMNKEWKIIIIILKLAWWNRIIREWWPGGLMHFTVATAHKRNTFLKLLSFVAFHSNLFLQDTITFLPCLKLPCYCITCEKRMLREMPALRLCWKHS